jgi:hypothetical protein
MDPFDVVRGVADCYATHVIEVISSAHTSPPAPICREETAHALLTQCLNHQWHIVCTGFLSSDEGMITSSPKHREAI